MSENYCEKISFNNDMSKYLTGRYGICRNASLDKVNKALYYNGNKIRLNCDEKTGVCTMPTGYNVTYVLQGGKGKKSQAKRSRRSRRSRKSRGSRRSRKY